MNAASPSRTVDAPWGLAFLRAGLLVTLPLAAVAALLVGVLSSWTDALSVLVGAALTAAFFCLSGAVIAWAGRAGDAFTLPAALGTFAVKVVAIAAVFQALPDDGWLDLRVLGWTVVVGALVWSVVQGRWVWTRQLYYVTPPAPPEPAPEIRPGSALLPAEDPEKPTTRG